MDDPKAQPFYSCIHNIKVIQPVAIWLAWGCSRQAMRCFLGNCPLVEGGRDTVFHLRRRVLMGSLQVSVTLDISFVHQLHPVWLCSGSSWFSCLPPITWLKEKAGISLSSEWTCCAAKSHSMRPCKPYSCLHSHSEMMGDKNAAQLWRCLDNIATIKPKTTFLENVLGFARVIDDVMKKIDGSARVLSNKAVQGFLHTAALPAVYGSCVPGGPGCRLLPKFNLILLKSNC